jgi:hypothetical protein
MNEHITKTLNIIFIYITNLLNFFFNLLNLIIQFQVYLIFNIFSVNSKCRLIILRNLIEKIQIKNLKIYFSLCNK